MTYHELDELLTLRWPGVVRRVMGDLNADEFTKGFVRSIAKHGRRATWLPSAKQEWVMRQLLAQYSDRQEADVDVIERE